MSKKQPASQKTADQDITLAFDVGYASIGWAALRQGETRLPEVLGSGVVTFPANDCLASQRRTFRRQRRHIRATKRRIQRMEQLLVHLGVMDQDEIVAKHAQAGGHSAPWLMAAQVLRHDRLLAWPELWDLLRWYAHNRGYDGNRRWSGSGEADADDDTQKEENAKRLMQELGTRTMAETFCRFLDVDTEGKGRTSSQKRFKGLNAAFPRRVVEGEVRAILESHVGKLPCLDKTFVETLMTDGRLLPCPAYKLPKRYQDGLLFGQSVPRFDNRIITVCPISGGKVCSKNSAEFLRFRWCMLLANVRIDRPEAALTKAERLAVDRRIAESGSMTPGEFKAAVTEATGSEKHNIDAMLLHPDAGRALILDPLRKLVTSELVASFWSCLPERLQKRARGQWRKGRSLTPRVLAAWCEETGADARPLLEAVASRRSPSRRSKRKIERPVVEPLDKKMEVERLSGRAPYARIILRKACDEVMAGFDPRRKCKASDPVSGEDKAADGVLVATDAMTQEFLSKPLDQLTNNHLVRHRLLILQRLVNDIVADPALGGDSSRVGSVTIEVNSEVKELSGKTAKQIAQDLGRRLGNFNSVVKLLKAAGIDAPSPGLIRKARVAEDLRWTCPYTGRQFSPQDLLHSDKWDKDHIVPYSDRPSNSLDSLVITTKELNLAKKNRTALEFIEQINRPENRAERDRLGVWTPRQYQDFVESLEAWKGHPDDVRRKRRRKHLLLLPKWEDKDKGFLPRDLTVTSHLTRLGALVLRRSLPHLEPHKITCLPGSVTATIRTGWKLLGCLAAANPAVVDEHGRVRTKTEIRDITHLHHALDAIVIALTSHYFPKNGRLWEAMVRREKQRTAEDNALLLATGLYKVTQHGVVFADQPPPELTEKIRARLAEKRVVQHIAADMGGTRTEQNTWRVLAVADQSVTLGQRMRGPDGAKQPVKVVRERVGKIVGLQEGKLSKLKGALVIEENYGIALDPEPLIIPWHKVWKRIASIRSASSGTAVRILRNGMLIRIPSGRYKGVWKVFSTKAALTLDLGAADKVALESKGEDQKREVQLRTLMRDGLEVVKVPLSGTTIH